MVFLPAMFFRFDISSGFSSLLPEVCIISQLWVALIAAISPAAVKTALKVVINCHISLSLEL